MPNALSASPTPIMVLPDSFPRIPIFVIPRFVVPRCVIPKFVLSYLIRVHQISLTQISAPYSIQCFSWGSKVTIPTVSRFVIWSQAYAKLDVYPGADIIDILAARSVAIISVSPASELCLLALVRKWTGYRMQ